MERHQAPNYIDPDNPDYSELAARLHDYLERSPRAEDLAGLRGDALVVAVIDWAKQDIDNYPDPHAVITGIFGPDVWTGKDWA